ncbi:MAG: hypothetical protein EOR60_15155 [Mesorhizobium sp.]|nr:MAG: hypothetical protein EOR60_15155 [Mesorhizobium sp.]
MSSGPNSASDIGVHAAAQWLANGSADRTKPAVPQLRKQFGLTAAQAIEAIRQRNLILAGVQ